MSAAARFSRTWATDPAFGMAMTPSCRMVQASAIWAGVAPISPAILPKVGSLASRPCSTGLSAAIEDGVGSADTQLATNVTTILVESAVVRADTLRRVDQVLTVLGPRARSHVDAWIDGRALFGFATTPTGYDVNYRLPLDDGGQLVAFESSPRAGVTYPEIKGREVFRFDAAGHQLWQIAPEKGTTNGRQHAFDPTIETGEPFVNMWEARDGLYTSRINGDTFLIDVDTGFASYSGWART